MIFDIKEVIKQVAKKAHSYALKGYDKNIGVLDAYNFLEKIKIGNISDGYHSFDELYHHRMVLFSIICNQNKDKAWKSLFHNDGTSYKDYFIVGIETKKGHFTYHYPITDWDIFDVEVLDKAPKWDGHTSKDINRLYSLLRK